MSEACVDMPGWDEEWEEIARTCNYIDGLEAWGMSIEDIPV